VLAISFAKSGFVYDSSFDPVISKCSLIFSEVKDNFYDDPGD
jgi:hypothetical protein